MAKGLSSTPQENLKNALLNLMRSKHDFSSRNSVLLKGGVTVHIPTMLHEHPCLGEPQTWANLHQSGFTLSKANGKANHVIFLYDKARSARCQGGSLPKEWKEFFGNSRPPIVLLDTTDN